LARRPGSASGDGSTASASVPSLAVKTSEKVPFSAPTSSRCLRLRAARSQIDPFAQDDAIVPVGGVQLLVNVP
jgi:hypothetical protein